MSQWSVIHQMPMSGGDNEDQEGGPDGEGNYVTQSFHQALI